MASNESIFYDACEKGDLETVIRLSDQVDVNYVSPGENDATALMAAAWRGRSKIVKYLLTLPQIDVNKKDSYGHTALYHAVQWDRPDVVKILTDDPRVDANASDEYGTTPLAAGVYHMFYHATRALLASEKQLEPSKKTTYVMGNQESAIDLAEKELQRNMQFQSTKRKYESILAALREYDKNPARVRRQMQLELGYIKPSTMLYAQIVLVSDGLLSVRESEQGNTAQRFYSITNRLPIELQMVAANRSQGSARDIISFQESELAFKDLARFYSTNN